MNIARQLAARFFGGDAVFARRTAGGIQPALHKEHSLRSRIMSTPIPARLSVPVGNEKSGAVSMLVNVGDRVLKYQPLAVLTLTAHGCSTVPVHAPTSGVITAFTYSAVADHSEQQQLCIVLDADGDDEALGVQPCPDYSQLSAEQIVSLIREAGIIGMGGAGFPAADKLTNCDASETEYLIINAAECEPYISADEALIRERADRVVVGADILRLASKARRCLIAIEDSKPDAVSALQQALPQATGSETACELIVLPSKYPAGSERQLIHAVTGRELAADRHPTEQGIVMHNTGTAFAIFEAIVEGKPCISRITTLCGQALQTPKNFEALIGTPVNYLFELCGIDASKKTKSILGGSLMGSELISDEAAVCKTTNCLIAAAGDELGSQPDTQACIRCGFCADACPVRLLPQQLLAFSKASNDTQLLEHGLLDCIECGACDYVCPSHIPLVSIYKQSKASLQDRAQDVERSSYWQQRFQFRQYRIKKEKDQAQSSKPRGSASPKQASEPVRAEPEIISKEQASRDIAAAVARVKARRGENKP